MVTAHISTVFPDQQQFGTLRVYVIKAKFSAVDFTSVKVTKLSSQTLRKSSSFRTLRRLHELAKLSTLTALHNNYTSRCAVHTMLHYELSNAPSASDVSSPSPGFQWGQSCLTIWRTQNSSAARISSSESSFSFEIRHSNDPNTSRGAQYLLRTSIQNSKT